MANWDFKSMHDIEINGFNSHGDSFKDKPIYHLAKEICQNSTDTIVLHEMNENEPIRIEIKEFWINPNEIPGNENGELTKVFEEELAFSRERYLKDHTVPDIYAKTVDIIKSDKIRCLRISDFNTPGLDGSDKDSDIFCPWNNLTKNVGVSDKSEESAGSKGEGKFVTFLCSDLYTVFYSTICKTDKLCASRGVTRISGYKKQDGTITLGPGYYDEGGKAIRKLINLDKEFKRNEYGTDIYIIGFRNTENWEEIMASSIIENFLISIMNNKLEVNINQKYQLNKEKIGEYIHKDIINKIIIEESPETMAYYNLLISENVIVEQYSMFKNNDIKLLLKEDEEDYSDINQIAAVRFTGMKIMNLKHFPRNGLYHGILLMDGKEVNKYFRKLENATHSKWSKDSETAPDDAQFRIDELRSFIKDSINKHFKIKMEDEMNATGVEETLPDEEEFDGLSKDDKTESIDNKTIKNVKINKKNYNLLKEQSKNIKDDFGDDDVILDDEGNVLLPFNNPNPPINPPQPNSLPHQEELYSNITRKILANKLRLIQNKDGYKLIFMISDNEPILKFSFDIYGENKNEHVKIKNCNCNTNENLIDVEYVEKDVIIKNISNNEEYVFSFDIDSDGIYPLEVKIYGINQ